MNPHPSIPCRARPLTAVLAALALFGAACSESAAATGAAGATPIEDYLGQEPESTGWSDQSLANVQNTRRLQQEAVAACMQNAGFEYVPWVDTQELEDRKQRHAEWESVQDKPETYGFGISTLAYAQQQVGPDLVGHSGDADSIGSDKAVNPNLAIFESLDEPTQQAYELALYGENVEIDDDMSNEEVSAIFANVDSCENAPLPAGADPVGDFYERFDEQLDEVYRAVLGDPRVTAAVDEVNACLIGKGMERWDLQTREPLASMETRALDAEYTTDDTEPDVDQEGDESSADRGDSSALSSAAKAELAEIQAEELAYAEAWHECEIDFHPFEMPPTLREIANEYEARFISENADQLAEFKGAAES